jgi:hypothetical protein
MRSSSNRGSLTRMVYPVTVCVVTPILVGLIFRFVGEYTNRPLLGT